MLLLFIFYLNLILKCSIFKETLRELNFHTGTKPDIDYVYSKTQEIILELLKKFLNKSKQSNIFNSYIVSKTNMHNDAISSFLELPNKQLVLGRIIGSLSLWFIDYINSNFDKKFLLTNAHKGAITSL